MAAIALAGFLDCNGMPPNGTVLTAVLPGGCPLACPFCIVNARGERAESSWMMPQHLTGALNAIVEVGCLGAVAIVGDEPLQKDAWPYAKALLDAGSARQTPMALITNGFELADFVDDLAEYPGLRILVSIDGVGEAHDRIRGRRGAFKRIANGIRQVAEFPELHKNLSVATTMLPRNIGQLSEILRFVKSMQIPRWVVSPLLSSARDQPIRIHPKVLGRAAQEVPKLLDLSEAKEVSLHVGDEFGLLCEWETKLRSAGVDVLKPRRPPSLVRIDGKGCIETLKTIRDGTSTGLVLPRATAEIRRVVTELLSREFCQPKSAT